jgi:heptose I phosphotransferase
MIDFHRLQRHPVTSPWWQAKDIGQLLYSSDVDGVTLRDRIRFWKLYTKDRSGWLWFVRGTAQVRARNHRGHNVRNPQFTEKAA